MSRMSDEQRIQILANEVGQLRVQIADIENEYARITDWYMNGDLGNNAAGVGKEQRRLMKLRNKLLEEYNKKNAQISKLQLRMWNRR